MLLAPLTPCPAGASTAADRRRQIRDFLISRRALRLADAERIHLFDLARPEVTTRIPRSPGVIRPSVQRKLDAFTGGMALVRNRRWDYLAANALGRAVYADPGLTLLLATAEPGSPTEAALRQLTR